MHIETCTGKRQKVGREKHCVVLDSIFVIAASCGRSQTPFPNFSLLQTSFAATAMPLNIREDGESLLLSLEPSSQPERTYISFRPSRVFWCAYLPLQVASVCCIIGFTVKGVLEDDCSFLFATQFIWFMWFMFCVSEFSKHEDNLPAVELEQLMLSKVTGRLFASPKPKLLRPAQPFYVSLRDIRFFRCMPIYELKRASNLSLTWQEYTFGVEVVSLSFPQILGLSICCEEQECTEASARLNACLEDWLEEQTHLQILTELVSFETAHEAGAVTIARDTVLMSQPPPESQFKFLRKHDDTLVCWRRRPFPQVRVAILALGLFQWFVWLILFLLLGERTLTFSSVMSNGFVITATICWALPPFVVTLVWWKGEKWIFCSDRAKYVRYCDIFRSTRHLSEVSGFYVSSDPVTDCKTWQGIRKKVHLVGGEKFALHLRPERVTDLFRMSGILEGEALFIAHELRRMYPQLCQGS